MRVARVNRAAIAVVVEVEANEINLREREIGGRDVIRQAAIELHVAAVGREKPGRAARWIAIVGSAIMHGAILHQPATGPVDSDAIAHRRIADTGCEAGRPAADVVNQIVVEGDAS